MSTHVRNHFNPGSMLMTIVALVKVKGKATLNSLSRLRLVEECWLLSTFQSSLIANERQNNNILFCDIIAVWSTNMHIK